MTRLSRRDVAVVGEICAELETVHLSRPQALPLFVDRLRRALSVELAASYSVRAENDGFALDTLHTAGDLRSPDMFREQMNAYIADSSERIGLFNPLHPEPKQRNRIICVDPAAFLREPLPPALPSLGLGAAHRAQIEKNLTTMHRMLRELGLEARHQVRALVCERATMLAWVGGFTDGPPNPRQVGMLRALLPSLRRRLAVENRLHRADYLAAALDAALEQLCGAAFLVDHAGHLKLANQLGERHLARNRRGVTEAIETAIRHGSSLGGWPSLTATPVTASGLPPSFLLVEHSAPPAVATLIAAARVRYALTPRETQVLEHLARGESNKEIANALRCAERTVEVHVSSVLRKLDVDTRGACMARLLDDDIAG